MSKVNAIPQGLHTVTSQLTLKNCAEALEFYKKAFGAEETGRAPDPSGTKIWHASFKIGDSTIYCNDEFPEMGSLARPASFWIYGEEVDRRFQRAVAAGCKVAMPLADMFWGDRMGKVVDPWGVDWSLSQRVKDLTPAQMQAAADAMIAEMNKQK